MSKPGGATRRSARRVSQITLERELGYAFGRYAEKVILDRAIPDIRDGLKPVQRRIIYAMYESGNTADKAYRKSAKTVGEVMGNYHPHGDSSIYEALVRLAQPWKMRYPLIDGHGNFGSLDDDPAAAMRYTEARLSPIALAFLQDIDKDTVPWRPNFDEKTQEPVVLPTGLLGLLLNGTSGVSAGFATEVPSHNLSEVTDACLAYLENPDLDTAGLMAFVQGPDFPTGGVMMGLDGLREAYEGGRGKVVLRGRYTLERQRDGKTYIIFSEIPYNVVKTELVRQLDALRLGKGVQGVLDVRDESGREGIRIVIELSRTADSEGVLAFLLKKTDLQVNYHFNVVSILRNSPKQLGLRAIIREFVNHRRVVVRRRSQYGLDRAANRLHEVEGLIKALDILDEVIATIRASKNRADARSNLGELGFTPHQADAILDLRLVRLTNLEILQLTEEFDKLSDLIRRYEAILSDPAICDSVVADELADLKKRFGDPRRTTIEADIRRLDVDLAVTVKAQDVVVGVTEQGWIKRASIASFQASGGDRKSSGVRPGDRMHDVVHTNTRHSVLVFTTSGQCYPLQVHQVPEAKWGDVGTALVNVCGIGTDDSVTAVIARDSFPEDLYLLFVTEKGAVKATPLSDFSSTRTIGLTAMRLVEGDRLCYAAETTLQGSFILATRLGRAIRFDLSQVSQQGRQARGVRGMVVGAKEEICSVAWVPPEPVAEAEGTKTPARFLVVFTESGKAKLTPLGEMVCQNRGGKGVRVIVHRRGKPHRCAALSVCELDDEFEVVDTHGVTHRVECARIPVTRRDGNAWTVVTLKDGAQVALIERLAPVVEEEETDSPDPDSDVDEQAMDGGETSEESAADIADAEENDAVKEAPKDSS